PAHRTPLGCIRRRTGDLQRRRAEDPLVRGPALPAQPDRPYLRCRHGLFDRGARTRPLGSAHRPWRRGGSGSRCEGLSQGSRRPPLGRRARHCESGRNPLKLDPQSEASAAPARLAPRGQVIMRLSNYFLPTLKENPAEAQIPSHRLMLRAGMVRQTAAGIYAWLPLGLAVLRRIEAIVRDEQARAGAIELLM